VTAARKYVNLIHVEDLAAACLAALEHGVPGTVYNVSDGQPRTWDAICRIAADRWHIFSAPRDRGSAVGKRISNARFLALLEKAGTRLRHPDLAEALQALRKEPINPSATP
jgi:nucleoside-diphosphate-sugar epimerase